ncbi:MAG: V-type ATP synthase subunit K [Candidatus Omnitrophica bacterium]|nr:V-type ATP synthase subunit K [Candidatus Omnitrophota bacterium]MBU2044229.1 V-type ATP synthase subunit K [Candidatus Omnitrophota bacterium]MBU2473454.1 V-type ATP synthase subunit K [Candidatus Omnitrophota bacterium]
MIQGFGDLNLSLTLAAVGSALGTGVAGMAAVGAWKKAFLQNKAAAFSLVAFVGAPLTQTIYGMILRNQIIAAKLPADPQIYTYLMILGLAAGLAIGTSAYMQGKAAAKACDALGETGKGFGQYIIVLGIIETVALFVMVFCMMAIPKV